MKNANSKQLTNVHVPLFSSIILFAMKIAPFPVQFFFWHGDVTMLPK